MENQKPNKNVTLGVIRNVRKLSFVFLATTLLFSSCSLEKRVYNSGYHIEWYKKKNASDKQFAEKNKNRNAAPQTTDSIDVAKGKVDVEKEVFVSADEEVIVLSEITSMLPETVLQNESVQKKLLMLNDGCDIIVLKNGQEIRAKVLEITQTEIKYKQCDNQNGPTFSKNKSEIFTIIHPNGTSTIIDTKTSKSNKDSSDTEGTSDKSLGIAVLLWFFLGGIGIHRFYLGHTGMGVLYLLTLSLCGIGWLIDGFLFLTGGLQPKSGRYKD